ncbi:MAG: hypothetical protein LBO75_02310 [Bifidobacteriaceae bacterium]|jgi:hypothetical protein|nr:hypothetical protein [Bifidobacteriaceae bacterium]
MTTINTDQGIDLERRFTAFDPAAATVYEQGDSLPPDVRLIQAVAAREFHLRQAEAVMGEAVADARASGWSWHRIGLVLGTTGEGARQRYSRLVTAAP